MERAMRRYAVLFAVLSTGLLYVPPALAAGSMPSATMYRSATAATLERTPAAVSGPRSSSPAPARGTRRVARGGSHPDQAALIPSAVSSRLNASAPSLLANFNGVSSRDSEVTNFGAKFEPPDQGLCAGNGFVVEMVNSAYTVYKPDGTVVTGPFNVNGPFDEGLIEFTSDPRCHYDAATHTWFAVILFINRRSTVSRIDLAVNTSGDPTTIWTNYRIDTTDIGGKTGPKHPGCPCLGDQPTLGIDTFNVYVTTNEFSLLGPEFNGAQVYAIAKSDLVGLKSSVHFVHFDKLSMGGAKANSVQPALTTGSPGAEYFLSSLDPNGTFDQRIGVWAMTRRAVVASGGVPVLSSVVLNSEAYGVPPRAEQKGTFSRLDSGDDRMQQVQYIGGEVWGALGTAVTIPGDHTPRAGAAWFKVHPVLSGDAIDSAEMHRQGYVALLGNYLLYPAIQANPNGDAVMALSLSGRTQFPSAAYALLAGGGASFGDVHIAAPGTTHYDPAATRWGDYAWAVLDPDRNTFWLASEYVPDRSSQTSDRKRGWGTRVLHVSPGT